MFIKGDLFSKQNAHCCIDYLRAPSENRAFGGTIEYSMRGHHIAVNAEIIK